MKLYLKSIPFEPANITISPPFKTPLLNQGKVYKKKNLK